MGVVKSLTIYAICMYIYIYTFIIVYASFTLYKGICFYPYVCTHSFIDIYLKEIDVSEQRPVDRGYLLYIRDNSYPVI